MLEWYLKKLDEFIQLANYCKQPLLEAHFRLARKSISEQICVDNREQESALSDVIKLSILQAQIEGKTAVSDQLELALKALEDAEADTPNVIDVDFGAAKNFAS